MAQSPSIDAVIPTRLAIQMETDSQSDEEFEDARSLPLEQSPENILSQQLSLPDTTSIERNVEATVQSSNVYGLEPAWGWDFVLTFPMPPCLKRVRRNTDEDKKIQPSTVQEDGSNMSCSGKTANGGINGIGQQHTQTADGETELDERSRKLICDRVQILTRLKSAGFVFSQLFIPSEKIILVRLSLAEEQMKQKAIDVNLELKLKEKYGSGYLKFSFEREEVFKNHAERGERRCYFCPADRAIIILAVLQSKEDWGCDLNIEKLLYDQTVLQAFCLHSKLEQRSLISKTVWARVWDPTYVPPFNDLKNYLGARVSYYFVFVSFYAQRLCMLALISIPVYVLRRTLDSQVAIAALRWIFSLSLVIWTTVFLETWKRRSADINVEWGLNDYLEEMAEDTRPQYEGEMRYGFYCKGGFVSLADLVEEEAETSDIEEGVSRAGQVRVSDLPRNSFQEPREARNAKLQSLGVTILFVLLVGSITFLLLWFRDEIVQYVGRRTSSAVAEAFPGVVNGILITVFDSVWRLVSLRLTQRENHRTNQLFENSLVYKRFAFQFVSNYMSLFYIAFVRSNLQNSCLATEGDCMAELETQLASLVLTKATVGQLMEVIMPFVVSRGKQWYSRYKDGKHEAASARSHGRGVNICTADNRYVRESKLAVYEGTLDDYAELVIQFGYIVLFGVAFPLASAVAVLNNMVEIRTDGWKILRLSQRVNADDAADIGAWYQILEMLNVASTVTNVALLVFTADSLSDLFGPAAESRNLIAFLVTEHILLIIKYSAALSIADVRGRTYRKVGRQMFDVARWFDEGWREAFRGTSLLRVEQQQLAVCDKYANLFDTY